MAKEDRFDMTSGTKGIDVTKVNPYVFCTHTYEGSGGYLDGKYLIPFTRETNYKNRQREPIFKNYLKGIVDSLITAVFSHQAVRETDNEYFKNFLDNVTANGVSMQEFIKSLLVNVRLHGISFIVMDNFAELPASMQDAINGRIYPYIYQKEAYEYVSHTNDKYGRLTSITFNNGDVTVNEEKLATTITFSADWVIVKTIGNDAKVLSKKPNPVGFVPVIPVKLDATSGLQPIPPVYDIAKCNYQIFQQSSEQRNLEKLQCFSLLVLPGIETNSSVSIGADSILWIEPNATVQPSYISPDAAQLTTIMACQTQNINDLLAMGESIGASAVMTSSPESGVSKSYRFSGQSYALSTTSNIAEQSELAIADMFAKFINQSLTYLVEYESNFAPSMTEIVGKVNILKSMKDMTTDTTLTAKIDKQLDIMFNQVFEWTEEESDDTVTV